MAVMIKAARERAGLTQRELAKALGISAATMCGYEAGDHAPRPETLLRIADLCGVTTAFLLGREGERGASDEAMALARAFDRLDSFGRDAVKALMEAELRRVRAQAVPEAEEASEAVNAASPVEEPSETVRPRLVRLRYYVSPAAAGSPNEAESRYTEVDYPASMVPSGTRYAVGISGASMEPDIPDGATVFVGAADVLYDGDIVVAWIDGEGAVCKRACVRGQTVTRLMSCNRDYPDITGARLEDMRLFGRVLGTDAPGRSANAAPMRMTDVDRGERLRAKRRAAHMNATDLAQALGVGEQVLRRYEDGITPIPPQRMQRLCDILSLDPFVWQ